MDTIVSVVAHPNYTVTIWTADGKKYMYNAAYLINKIKLLKDKVAEDPNFFVNNCAIINNTVAWFLDANDTLEQKEENCIDIAPEQIEKKAREI